MAKVSEESRLQFSRSVKPYKEKIKEMLNAEKSALNAAAANKAEAPYKKKLSCALI